MIRKADNLDTLFKAGVFIIFTLSILMFSVLWLRYFSLTPDKTITVQFKEIGPVSKGIPVYYHGVSIGKVSSVKFSKDFKYTLVTALIYQSGMNLPKNVYGEVKSEGITGQKFLEIIYPDKPSEELLQDGDTIEGRLSDYQQILKSLSEATRKGELKTTFKELKKTSINMSKTTENANVLILLLEEIANSNKKDIRTLVRESAVSATNIRISSGQAKKLSTSPEICQNIRSSICNIAKSSQRMDIITTKADKITDDIDKITGNPQFRQNILRTSDNTACLTERINRGDLNCLIKKTLLDTDRTINRYDCIGGSFSEMMTERFLLMRLMFGKPGQSFEKCTDLKCIEEELKNQNSYYYYYYNYPYYFYQNR